MLTDISIFKQSICSHYKFNIKKIDNNNFINTNYYYHIQYLTFKMNKISYYNQPNVTSDQYIFYHNIWHILFRNNGKNYIIKLSNTNTSLVQSIQSVNSINNNEIIIDIISYTHDLYVICTNVNTYFYDQFNKEPKKINCVCQNPSEQIIITKNLFMIKLSDNINYFIYVDGKIEINPRIISDFIAYQTDKGDFSYRSWNNIVLPLGIIPEEIFTLANNIYVILFNSKFYSYNKNYPNFNLIEIDKEFTVNKIFYDNSIKTLFTSQNYYIIDTDINIWTFKINLPVNVDPLDDRIDVNYYVTFNMICPLKKLKSDINVSDIREIFKYKELLIIITNKSVIYYYQDKFNELYDNDNENDNANSNIDDKFKLISDIWDEIIIQCGKNKFILISSVNWFNRNIHLNKYIRIRDSNSDVWNIPDHYTYIVYCNTVDMDLFYTNGMFYTKTNNNFYNIGNVSYIDYYNSGRYYYEMKKKLTDYAINVENQDSNYFNTIFNMLIACNFNHYLCLKPAIFGSRVAAGPGASRSTYTNMIDNIKNDLFELELDSYSNSSNLQSYKLNLNNPFWFKSNNCFYFGKLLIYLINYNYKLNFHFSLPMMIYIYKKILKLNKIIDDFNPDELAPFHKIFNPTEYSYIYNMDDIYKNDSKFKELMLPYENFENMIYTLLNIRSLSEKEEECLSFMANGMYEFNNSISNMNLYQLTMSLCGDYVYNRNHVIKNFEISEDDPKLLTDKMKDFIENLTDDELKIFMKNITGQIIRENAVKILIKSSKSYDKNKGIDIAIQTCYDSVVISSNVFNNNYTEILKAYLCTKDTNIRD